MPTQASHITKQTDCIYLEVDQDAPLEELVSEAKHVAEETGKTVLFATYWNGRLFRVTADSDIAHMAIAVNDRYNCSMVIT